MRERASPDFSVSARRHQVSPIGRGPLHWGDTPQPVDDAAPSEPTAIAPAAAAAKHVARSHSTGEGGGGGAKEREKLRQAELESERMKENVATLEVQLSIQKSTHVQDLARLHAQVAAANDRARLATTRAVALEDAMAHSVPQSNGPGPRGRGGELANLTAGGSIPEGDEDGGRFTANPLFGSPTASPVTSPMRAQVSTRSMAARAHAVHGRPNTPLSPGGLQFMNATSSGNGLGDGSRRGAAAAALDLATWHDPGRSAKAGRRELSRVLRAPVV
jgi:hypothetical protein